MATDDLSDIFKTVRICGSVFYNVTATAPWVVEQLSPEAVVQLALPGADHIIAYHIIIEGCCFANITGSDTPVELRAGHVILFTRADAHTLSSSRGMGDEPVTGDALAVASIPQQQPFSVRMGNEAPVTARLISGFLAYNGSPFNPLLDNLPSVLIADSSRDGDMPWLGGLIGLAMREATNKGAGSESVLARLTELMFIEVSRQYLDRLSPKPEGWLAGLKDPLVGKALSLMHECPKGEWGLANLAREVGLSRSEFARRFACLVGDPPMQYLAKWRMHVASGLLNDNIKIATVATEVGYRSDSSFSRAFKKIVGVPPSHWRVRRDEGETAAGTLEEQHSRPISYSKFAP
jgi:AraC-like DNA-binding protein